MKDQFRFDYLTYDWYWALCGEENYTLYEGKTSFGPALNYLCDVRLCHDDEILLNAFGCLDADL